MNGKHTVRVENPHVESFAALVLLQRDYEMQQLADWLSFRDELLNAALVRDGKLVCFYCGRDDLVEMSAARKPPSNLATIDHVIPRSKGGGERDKDNCVIACFRCNQKKADKTDDFHGPIHRRASGETRNLEESRDIPA